MKGDNIIPMLQIKNGDDECLVLADCKAIWNFTRYMGYIISVSNPKHYHKVGTYSNVSGDVVNKIDIGYYDNV